MSLLIRADKNSSIRFGKYAFFGLERDERHLFEAFLQRLVPKSSSLLEAVKALLELAHKLRSFGVFKPGRLSHIEFFAQVAIEESRESIGWGKLVVPTCTNAEKHAYAVMSCHR